MSDVYIEVQADSLGEIFEEAGKALFETMTNLKRVKKIKRYEINIESEDIEALLFDWLGELIFIFDSKNLIFSEIYVHELKEENNRYKLKAELFGEYFNPEKHEMKTDIKAPTYSLMEIDINSNPMISRFVLDI